MAKITMLRKIMLATDFSERSRSVYPFAAGLARQVEAKIFLVHFANARAPEYSGVSNEDHARTIYLALRNELQHDAFADVAVSSRRLNRRVSQSLPVFEKEAGCDMVVTGTWRRKGMDRVFSTDFADEIVATSTVPVFVHGNIDETWHTGDPIRVLVPLERPETLTDRVPAIRFLKKNYECTFEFLFVQKRNADQVPWYERFFGRKREQRHEIENSFETLKQTELAEVTSSLEFRYGNPVDVIASRTREINAGLVIVGARGFRIGLAQRVIRHVDCSVLTIARDNQAYQKLLEDHRSLNR